MPINIRGFVFFKMNVIGHEEHDKCSISIILYKHVFAKRNTLLDT